MRHSVRWWVAALVLAVLLVGGDALAKKGGAKPGGGGGSAGIADADVSIIYCEGPFHTPRLDGPMWKGDNAGNVEPVSSLVVKRPNFGPAGTTRLVFVTDVEGYGIYVADDFSGGGLRKVVDVTENIYIEPSWSNDADTPLGEELIAFCEYDPGTGAVQLFVTTLDGKVTLVTQDTAKKIQACWNPVDSWQILVLRNGHPVLAHLDLGGDDGTTLVVAGYTDLTAGTVLAGVTVNYAAFAADGSKVVLEAKTAGTYSDIWTLVHDADTETNTATNLTNGALSTGNVHPCIRADGRVMFQNFYQVNPGTRVVRLWVMEEDGSNVRLYGNPKSRHFMANAMARR